MHGIRQRRRSSQPVGASRRSRRQHDHARQACLCQMKVGTLTTYICTTYSNYVVHSRIYSTAGGSIIHLYNTLYNTQYCIYIPTSGEGPGGPGGVRKVELRVSAFSGPYLLGPSAFWQDRQACALQSALRARQCWQ